MRNPWTMRSTAFGLTLLMTGCQSSFTYKLWHTGEFTHFREPATNPAVAVFYVPTRKDYLISYDSVRDGGDDPRRMSYFFAQNVSRIVEHKKPVFINTNGLMLHVLHVVDALPIHRETNAVIDVVFDKQLTIHTTEGEIGPYSLPDYRETSGVAMKTALTPLAVIGDITLVSLVAGLVLVFAASGSGYSTDAR